MQANHPLIVLFIRATHSVSSLFVWFLLCVLVNSPILMALATFHIFAMRGLPSYESAVLSWLSLVTKESGDVIE